MLRDQEGTNLCNTVLVGLNIGDKKVQVDCWPTRTGLKGERSLGQAKRGLKNADLPT